MTWNFDLTKITIAEYRRLFAKDQPDEEGDATLAKVAGIPVEEIVKLPYPEYRRLVKEFFEAAREPLNSPN